MSSLLGFGSSIISANLLGKFGDATGPLAWNVVPGIYPSKFS